MAVLLQCCIVPHVHFLPPRVSTNSILRSTTFKTSHSRIRLGGGFVGGVSEEGDKPNSDKLNSKDPESDNNPAGSFSVKLAVAMGMAVALTLLSIRINPPSFAVQCSADATSPSAVGFNFQAFGYRVLLPEYAPGWLYFWLLMAAGCGLFVSEEALNIWVGVSLSRLLLMDGTWQSFSASFSRNAPYIVSTILWVYWGVCISDMVPFYLGKLFRQANASDEVYSKLGIGKDKVLKITQVVRKYGNFIGFVERFSIGMRNPTAFVAGALARSNKSHNTVTFYLCKKCREFRQSVSLQVCALVV
uniref:Uncharacterized protein n=1 Tax=Kalanchoe fedtschenkoi TaxID=63787 RepID=A0A7N0UVU6_KALFE